MSVAETPNPTPAQWSYDFLSGVARATFPGIVDAEVVTGLNVVSLDAFIKDDSNATPGIQAALDYGLLTNSLVLGSPGKVYNLNASGLSIGVPYCIVWRTGYCLNLMGATLRLNDGQGDCSIIIAYNNNVATGSPNVTNTQLTNGIIDHNYAGQSYNPATFAPAVYLNRIGYSQIDLQIINAAHAAFYSTGTDSEVVSNWARLYSSNSSGTGIQLNGSRWQCPELVSIGSKFVVGDINVEGNPVIVSLRDSQIDRIYGENYGFGVKLQNACKALQIGEIIAIAGANTVAHGDFGVKFEGNTGPNINFDIQVGSIYVTGQPLSGLYLVYSERVEIGQYVGNGNSKTFDSADANRSDVQIDTSVEIVINSIISNDYGYKPLYTASPGNSIQIGQLLSSTAETTVEMCGAQNLGGQLAIATLSVVGSGFVAPVIYSAVPSGNNDWTRIGQMSLNLPVSNYIAAPQSWFVGASSANDSIRAENYTLAGFATEFTVAVANGTTGTIISNNSLFYNGDGPIVDVEPTGDNNSFLMALASPIVTLVRQLGHTGLNIQHHAAGADTTLSVAVRGWVFPFNAANINS